MKKRILLAVAAVAMVVTAGWNYQQSKQSKGLSELALANVEALATGEVHGSGGVANKRCPIWNVKYSESWTGTVIECSTGGSYKCSEGTCPHGV